MTDVSDLIHRLQTWEIYEQKTHRGGDFRDFLKERGVLGEDESRALKQALSLQLNRLLKEKKLTKTQMAARMKTSRAAVDRLLDASNSSVTLNGRPRLGAQGAD